MTLSPEERAMRVTDAILDLVMVDGENVSASVLHPAQDIIAKAIREACNEKLEEAERAILNEHSITNSDDLNMGLLRATRAVKAVRLRDLTP